MVPGSDKMKKFSLCLIAIAATAASFAAAQETEAPEAKAEPELPSEVCQQMATYHGDAEKGAEYQPGVDVHGKPVVEADLNKSPVQLPDTLSFDVTVDLAKYAGLAVPDGLEEKAVVGQIIIDNEGRMTFNGRPVEGDADEALRTLCEPKPKEEDEEPVDITE
jgi:hypothetical protein